MNKTKTKGVATWIIKWNPSYQGWDVMKQGFRANWYGSKYLAIEERDRLNKLDEEEAKHNE